jgi:MFS family permease
MSHDREPTEATRAAKTRMTAGERRATIGLAGIFGLRMLGMFIVLPVLALYAESLPGGRDHTLVGLALGAYGLTQAVLQVPFGWVSDRWGRKPVIVLGLVIFALGSFIAAWAPSIGWTIVGRTIQGAGAISAAVIALVADLTRDAVRTRAMAAIGMTIGATFAVSLVISPALQPLIGVPGIFVMTGVLALGAIVVLRQVVPESEAPAARSDTSVNWKRALVDRELLRLNYGIFALHAALLALFVQVPFMLRDNGVAPSRHALVYLPVLVDLGCADAACAVAGRSTAAREAGVRRRDRGSLRRTGDARRGRRFARADDCCARRVLHRVQPARSGAAFARIQVRPP